MKPRLFYALFLLAAIVSCGKENGNESACPPIFGEHLDPGIIEQEIVAYDESFSVTIPEKLYFEHGNAKVVTPEIYVRKMIDLHVEVLPLYVFGTQESVCGDYYAVRGYAVSHNAEVFSDGPIKVDSPYDQTIHMTGWYMSSFGVDLQLLDQSGQAVDNQSVNFFVTPEPSTTIGSTTYKKGFAFSLAPSVTIGAAKVTEPDKDPSWRNVDLGIVTVGFKWEDSSTQNIPDQSVMMSTDPYNRAVQYKLLTNNVQEEIGADALPMTCHNDQRFDFSFVWHVESGKYYARDNDFGNMRMKLSVKPVFKSNFQGRVQTSESDYFDCQSFDKFSKSLSLEREVSIPAINRIPTGTISFKNTTMYYVANVSIWRTGEYTADKTARPYSKVSGVYSTNQTFKAMTRMGEYDIVYDVKTGNGVSKGKYIVRGVSIGENETRVLSTMDGKKL